MDFSFTEEQEELRREARAFLEANPPLDGRAARASYGWIGIELAVRRRRSSRPPCSSRRLGRASLRRRRIVERGGRRATAADELLAASRSRRSGSARRRSSSRSRTSREREQFGKKIGAYQAVSHPLVDAYVAVELARSLAYWAAWCVAEDDEQADARRRRGEVARDARRPCSRARRRSRCTAASASPGSTRCTATTSARSARGRARVRPRACARRSPHPCCPRNRRVERDRRGVRDAPRRPRAGRSTRRCAPRGRGARGDDASSSSTSPTRDAIARAAAAIETLDGLVDNAGIAIAAPLEFLPPEELTRQLEVNVVGQLRVMQALLPALRRSRGRIVLMGSIAGRSALPFLGAYAMSKFALEAMADSLRSSSRRGGSRRRSSSPARSRRDLDEAAAGARGAAAEAARALRRAGREVPAARGEALVECARSGRDGREGGRARAHRREAEDPLHRRPRREAPRARSKRLPDRWRDRVLTRLLFGVVGSGHGVHR